jgi:amino acid transporter
MAKNLVNKKASFGTMPVFMTAISTILGAILFLRFGWAVGNVGLLGTIGIIVIGHLITIPTALAVAEIATNQKVLGGGAYYIISRSFGFNIGAAIGIALYLSQAISVAFYIIAFGEAFEPVLNYLSSNNILNIPDKRFITLPVTVLISVLMLTRGANMGMKFLYFVVALLFTSLGFFFMGPGDASAPHAVHFYGNVENPESFFYVFTIIFPAFTGIAAGLGLSGDLKNPQRAIPYGTVGATVAGLIIYTLAAFKFSMAASPEMLDSNQLIMSNISSWGPIIPIGLAAACLSSALGSIMVAPRTIQAIGLDDIFPNKGINKWLAKGKAHTNEPVNASLITIVIAIGFVFIGDVNFVAEIISMFFMITYGAICLISFLEHFAADPAYRPTFKSKWYLSAVGALLSFWIMFKMNTTYAIVSWILMSVMYLGIAKGNDQRGLAKLFRGVVFQLGRQLQVFAQRADKDYRETSWRPFAICISSDTFKRRSAFDIMRWISYKYGFGTYIHYIKGFLNEETNQESKNVLSRLINLASGSKNKVYLDTIISPSYTSAIAQVIQLTNISGKINNMVLFEFSRTETDGINEVLKNFQLLESTDFDICVLNTSYKSFGYKREIHVWISSEDFENANLMILLAYIIMGHPDWKKGVITIMATFPKNELDVQREKLLQLIKAGRIPISSNNVRLIPAEEGESNKEIIARFSNDADLTIIGFSYQQNMQLDGEGLFNGYGDVGNILFVSATKAKEIK